MKLLLDTQIFLWALNQDERTPPSVRDAINDPKNTLYLSIASIWEAAIKISIGKLSVPGGTVDSLLAFAEETGTILLPIQPAHLRLLQALPQFHRDPFDRLLVCQAQAEDLRLVSIDSELPRYLPNTLR